MRHITRLSGKLDLDWVGLALPCVQQQHSADVRSRPFHSVYDSTHLVFFLHVLFKLTIFECIFSFSIDTSLTLLCFLSSFHSFFLPMAWPVDLAVQGCKYHCGLFQPLDPFTLHPSSPPFRLLKDLGPSPPPHFNTPLSNVDLIWSFWVDWCHSPVDRTLVVKVTNHSATVTFMVYSYFPFLQRQHLQSPKHKSHAREKWILSEFLGSGRWGCCGVFKLDQLGHLCDKWKTLFLWIVAHLSNGVVLVGLPEAKSLHRYSR